MSSHRLVDEHRKRGRVEAPVVAVRNFVDGHVEIEVSTPYGETIASLGVTARRGFNERFAVHGVDFAVRDNLDRPATLLGSSQPVHVPLSTGEREQVAEELAR